jgi:hypothetical protein
VHGVADLERLVGAEGAQGFEEAVWVVGWDAGEVEELALVLVLWIFFWLGWGSGDEDKEGEGEREDVPLLARLQVGRRSRRWWLGDSLYKGNMGGVEL